MDPRALGPLPDDPDLTRAILARTSGSPCRRLHDLACAFVDLELDAAQDGLVRAHLERCPACAALVAALAATKDALPTFACADPGPLFTQRVLSATARASRPLPATRWSRLLHRPRICLEAAYLGAAAGVMGFYLPAPPLPFTGQLPALVRPLGASAQRVAGQLVQVERRTAASVKTALAPRKQQAAGTLIRFWHQCSARIQQWLAWARGFLQQEKPSRPANP